MGLQLGVITSYSIHYTKLYELAQFDLNAQCRAGHLLQQSRCPQGQICIFWHARQRRDTHDLSVRGDAKAELVTVVKELKDGLQRVVTVWAASGHVQEQV